MKKTELELSANRAGLYTLALRLVIGWTYFSAFWRRVALSNKLDPDVAGYIGEKFNHFLPNALGIKPLIQYMVENSDFLHVNMVAFTIIEGIVGLLLMLGLFSRLMGIGVFLLAMGILLGSGWIGTTCLDEWQIGVLGVAGGFTLFLTGSGLYSVDNWLMKRNVGFTQKKWFTLLGSGELKLKKLNQIVLVGSFAILGLTLATNQIFHGGVWGTLHNKSVRPIVEISNVNLNDGKINFEVYRVEGADVYGSFLIGIDVEDKNGNTVKSLDLNDLASFPLEDINNHYIAKVKPGKHSLIIPLGAKADLSLSILDLDNLKGGKIKLTDISGAEWEQMIK